MSDVGGVDASGGAGGVIEDPLESMEASELEEQMAQLEEMIDLYEAEPSQDDQSESSPDTGSGSGDGTGDGSDESSDEQKRAAFEELTDDEQERTLENLYDQVRNIKEIAGVKMEGTAISPSDKATFAKINQSGINRESQHVAKHATEMGTTVEDLAHSALATSYATRAEGALESGAVTQEEYDDFMASINGGPPITPAASDKFLSEIDPDTDKTVSQAEYDAFIDSVNGGPAITAAETDELMTNILDDTIHAEEPPYIPKKPTMNMFQSEDPMAEITTLMNDIAKEAHAHAKELAMFKADMNVAVKDMAMQVARLTQVSGHIRASKTMIEAGGSLAQAGATKSQMNKFATAKKDLNTRDITNNKGKNLKVSREKPGQAKEVAVPDDASPSSQSQKPDEGSATYSAGDKSKAGKAGGSKIADKDEPISESQSKTPEEQTKINDQKSQAFNEATTNARLSNELTNKMIEGGKTLITGALDIAATDNDYARDQIRATQELVQTTQQDIGATEREMSQHFASTEQAIQKHIDSNNQISRDIWVNFGAKA